MQFLHDWFLFVFSLIYPLIHNHLISYLLIFLLFTWLGWLVWKTLLGLSKPKTLTQWAIKFSLFLLELLIVLFLAWYVIVHFQTFRFH